MYKVIGMYGLLLSILANLIFINACFNWDRPGAILSLGVCFISGSTSIVGIRYDKRKIFSIIALLLSFMPLMILKLISR